MQTLQRTLGLLGIVILLSGCVTRQVVILDKDSDVVRLGKDVKGSVYIFQNGEWVLVGKAQLPEGWYAGPGPSDLK